MKGCGRTTCFKEQFIQCGFTIGVRSIIYCEECKKNAQHDNHEQEDNNGKRIK